MPGRGAPGYHDTNSAIGPVASPRAYVSLDNVPPCSYSHRDLDGVTDGGEIVKYQGESPDP
jgi:hypothetical protein